MENETHDFMNVDSFSELPFLRPSPPVKEKGIRLFGKQFSSGTDIHKVAPGKSESVEINTRGEFTTTSNDNENGESNRKFECHYCCRNFPTSQALGGHQNAHKRERQQAKRAHLQSAMVHGGYPEAHVYGIVNYNRFGSASSQVAMPYHPSASWNSSNDSINSRFYEGHGFYNSQRPQPITGSPLALWRLPSAHSSSGYGYERAMNPPPLLANNEMKASSNTGSSSLQNRYLYESKASHVKDNVSLDLHL
ncbi:putative sphingosine-1-phosphate phosphohydrolase [Heracleum sosnowskyi]|uniref:Sphingosine-1-phosphate phosphohydrolase n=1 Tax=Heracleum sosnowskyi TaxID=360622 RepID=A0AAD8MV61_9APIA|nr:putative sphingosine-1-phosphate phosphohydrolase [Heracleum sosnowskyi]